MSEQQAPYITIPPVENSVTITVSREWADFITRAQERRKHWRSHRIERIGVIDWGTLAIGDVLALEK